MSEPLHLTDVFPLWISGNGIFSALQSFDIPWKSDNINADLDLEYYGNVSGDKIISPLIAKIMSGSVLSQTEVNMIASAIYNINGLNWNKLWDTLELQYDPIENYSMTEIMTDDETVTEYGKTTTKTNNLTHAKTGTETEAPNITETRTDNLHDSKTGTEQDQPNLTETTTPNLTNTSNNGLYGFNSSAAVNSNTSSTSATGTNTVAKTGTETKTYNLAEGHTGTQQTSKGGTNQVTYNTNDTDTGTSSDAETGSDTHTRNYTLTRSGNIGVTTSQQMIESERELWKYNFFRDVVFPDVDRVLSLLIY